MPKIQTFQNIPLFEITNVPPCISNLTLHTNLKIETIHEETVTFYTKFHSKLFPSLPLILYLAVLSIYEYTKMFKKKMVLGLLYN